jgi:uncharacterized protein YkwD
MHKTAIAVLLATAALFSAVTSQATACSGVKLSPSRQGVDNTKRAITCLINRSRRHHGLRRLHGSVSLGNAAQVHSDAMASQNFFSHDGDDGTPTTRAEAAGYMAGARSWGLGETLEWASGKGASPGAIVRGWMGSAVHRSVILSRQFRQIGIGITNGSPVSPDVQGAAVFTADFGFRKG